MKLQEFVDTTCQNLELSGLVPDADGNYAIVFDGNLEVEIVPQSETRLLLRSRLAPLPEDPREHESFLRTNLQRNLANLHEQQAALTIDRKAEGAGCLWLYRGVNIHTLDPTAVADLIEDFVNLADWWSQSDDAPGSLLPSWGMLRP